MSSSCQCLVFDHQCHGWSNLIICDHVWSSVITLDHLWSRLIICDHVWSSVITFDHKWSSISARYLISARSVQDVSARYCSGRYYFSSSWIDVNNSALFISEFHLQLGPPWILAPPCLLLSSSCTSLYSSSTLSIPELCPGLTLGFHSRSLLGCQGVPKTYRRPGMCVRIHACVYVWWNVCVLVCMYVCINVCVYICMCVHKNTRACLYAEVFWI
jgi:hypothetical protein